MESNTIKEGNQVILKANGILKLVKAVKKRSVWLEKTRFTVDGMIGHTYGSSFEAKNGQLVKTCKINFEDDNDGDKEAAKDNRHLTDAQTNQKLSRDDIVAMRKDGLSGNDIVDQLIENSATFRAKTEFAQQKYIKKKKKKYVPIFTAIKPCARLLTELYYNRGPSRILNMRSESVAQILTYINAHAGCKLLISETCTGLLIGALMERMGGYGSLVQLYHGSAPARQAIENYNFPEHFDDSLHSYPMDMINRLRRPGQPLNESHELTIDVFKRPWTIKNGASKNDDEADPEEEDMEEDEADCVTNANNKRVLTEEEQKAKEERLKKMEERRVIRLEKIKKAKSLIEEASMDGLIVASKFHPTPIVLSLLHFVSPSRPIVVYSQHKEPIMDCFVKLRDKGCMVNLRMSETWLRDYQVLSNRTHPVINMTGTGGYLLTGTTVMPDS